MVRRGIHHLTSVFCTRVLGKEKVADGVVFVWFLRFFRSGLKVFGIVNGPWKVMKIKMEIMGMSSNGQSSRRGRRWDRTEQGLSNKLVLKSTLGLAPIGVI